MEKPKTESPRFNRTVRGLAGAAIFLVSACGSQSTAAINPTASGARVANSTPSTAASPSQPVFAFTCRLPVMWSSSDPSVDGRTGLMTFPPATLSVNGTSPKPAQLTSTVSYDRAVGRWLPVSREAIAPDGLHYAYADYDPPGPNDGKVAIGTTGRVHVVDARTGTDRAIYSGAPTWAIVDFDSAGIYLTRLTTGQYAPQKSGLYLIDPTGGTPRPVAGGDASLDWGGWRMLNGGAAWGTAFSGGGVPAMWSGNELWRLDIRSGVATSWFKVRPRTS
jgi:hypothetical protein